MKCLLAVFAVCVLLRGAHCASTSINWCYHLSSCNDATWPTIAANFCNGSRQSPIDIVSSAAKGDANLTAFTFTNFSNTAGLSTIQNTGKTVKVILQDGIGFSGGGLSEPYVSLQFHLHWGNGSSIPGSEHTVDGKRYPMELHIVNIKSSLNGNITQGFADSEGFAALGFFIEAASGNATNSPQSWQKLTSYLANITEQGQSATITDSISLDDLLPGVDRTKYYRYLGSLTTPTCNEAVVWTVFKDTVKVSKDLIDLFASTVRIGNSSSEHMVNVYRNLQPQLPVTTQVTSTSAAIGTRSSLSLGLVALGLAVGLSWV